MNIRRTVGIFIAAIIAAFALGGAELISVAGDTPEAEAAHNPRTTTIRYGPYDMPAGDGTHEGGGSTDNQIDLFAAKPCIDCFIIGIAPNAVWSENDPMAPGQQMNFSTHGMLHHVVLANLNRDDPTCDRFNFAGLIGLLGERIFASGNERTIMNLPSGYGYYVGIFDSWSLVVDLMNHMAMPRSGYIEMTYTWVPRHWFGTNPRSVRPVWLDIDNCADSEVDLPMNYSDTHSDWTSSFGGTLIGAGGHVHEHGISISVENATRGGYLCTSVAGYPPPPAQTPRGPGAGTPGHPANYNTVTSDPFGIENYRDDTGTAWLSDMTLCTTPVSYQRGDVLRVHAQYHNGSAHAHHGQMGIMVLFIRPN